MSTLHPTALRRPSDTLFRLGDWIVAPAAGALHRGEHTQRLEPRAMDVLVRLSASAGETIAAEQLLVEIWRGTFYGDNPVHKAIAQIRRALGDTSSTPRYIETVRKRGYRVLVPVLMDGRSDARSGYEPSAWSMDSPFRGLRPFEAQHAAVYFGRSHVVARVLTAIREQRANRQSLVLVVGGSGSGKTSLLQAGILPMLLKGSDGVRALGWARCNPGSGPTDGLLDAVARAMLEWRIADRPVFLPTERQALVEQLRTEPTAVGTRISAAIDRERSTRRFDAHDPCLVMLLDPLEAALSSNDVPSEQRACFDRALSVLAEHPQTLIVGACRADFYPLLLKQLPRLATVKGSAGHIDLPALTAAELTVCVRAPSRAAGLAFEFDAVSQERLDDRLIEDARRAPEMLPMLQHVLDQLYAARDPGGTMTFAAYREIGGLSGAIALHADAVLDALDAPARATLDDVLALVAVVHVDQYALVSRRAALRAIARTPSERLVDALIDARLFSSELVDGQRQFGVAHEVLLRQWPRAMAWADANRASLQTHARLRAAANHWEAEGRAAHLLVRSARLAAAGSDLCRRAPERLTSVEHAFVAASLRIVRLGRVAAMVAITVIAALAMVSAAMAMREKLARNVAEARRAQMNGLLDFTLGDLAEKLRPIGRLDVLGSVAGQALDTLSSAPSAESNTESALQRVRALRMSAEVLVEQGALAGAEQALIDARALVSAAVAENELEPTARFERSQVAYWQGLLDFRGKRFADARAQWTAYAEDARALRDLEPQNPQWLLEHSYALNNLGTLAKAEGDFQESVDAFTQSVLLKRDYLARVPGDTTARPDLADSISWLADAQDRRGLPLLSIPLMAEQLVLLLDAYAQDPRNARTEQKLALAYVRSGLLSAAVGHSESAVADLLDGLNRLSALARRDPSNRTWQRDVAYAELQLGWLLAVTGDRSSGLARIKRARVLLEPLVDIERPPLEWRRLWCVVLLREAILEDRGTSSAAMAPVIENSVRVLQAIADQAPEDADTRSTVAMALVVRGDWLSSRGSLEQARESWSEAAARVLPTLRVEPRTALPPNPSRWR